MNTIKRLSPGTTADGCHFLLFRLADGRVQATETRDVDYGQISRTVICGSEEEYYTARDNGNLRWTKWS